MGITTTTDYGIRTICYLASFPELDSISGKEISEKMVIPYNYFLKVVPKLKDAGLLISHQGKKGGYTLIRDPKDISLYDIILAMEDTYVINQCLMRSDACSRDATSYCPAHGAFQVIQDNLDYQLNTIKVADLLDGQVDGLLASFSDALRQPGKSCHDTAAGCATCAPKIK